MFKFLILCIFTCLYTLLGADMVGKGIWSLVNLNQCSEEGLTLARIDYKKHKINRTQDAITAHLTVAKEVTKAYGLHIEICKYVDGGCKLFQIIAGNLGQLCDKYAKKYIMEAMKMAKCKNEYFPIPAGEYDIEDYYIDACRFPPDCVYGRFEFKVYLLYNFRRIGCFKTVYECNKCEDGEDCCGGLNS